MTRSRSSSWHAAIAVTCLAAAVLAGCGDGRPKVVPVSGRVLIDGQPVRSGTICVIPENARAAAGDIGPDGWFVLSCFGERDGVTPGTHRVTVTSFERIDDMTRKWLVPKKYSDIDGSGLTVTVDGPNDSLTVNLTWGGEKPLVERVGGGE